MPSDGYRTMVSPRPVSRVGALMIWVARAWQLVFSSWLAPSCRFVPSCSDYAVQAVQLHGPLRGGWLAICRLSRCHPLGGSGLDEVPPAKLSQLSTHLHSEQSHCAGRCAGQTTES
ncbi:MAG: membrane protein insertion efficiency factor YidD [Burkholderiaceae bacterium]